MMKKLTKIILVLLGLCLVTLGSVIVKSPTADTNRDVAELYVLDVGQGDSILIQRGHYQVLIDGGPDDKVLSLLGQIMPIGDREIEKMVLTHPHADHITGLNQVIDRYQVDSVYGSGVLYSTNEYLQFLNLLKEKKISLIVPEIGEKVPLFANGSLQFLWPGSNLLKREIKNPNNGSEVARFCYFTHCALLTGDIETDGQTEMLLANKDHLDLFQAEILKLPHHGSRNGAGEALFTLAGAKYGVISAGLNNQFGHPHQEALDMLINHNMKILETMKDGTVKFFFHPDKIVLAS